MPLRSCRNRLLSLLSDAELQRLSPHLHTVHTEFKQVIIERDDTIEYVYFPCSAVFSVLTILQNATAVEAATIGYEGFCGSEILTGGERAAGTTICKVPGASVRMRVSSFRQLTESDTPLRRVTQRFFQTYLCQVLQSVACNRLHSIQERFARWLLMTHDRTEGDRFYLTQEFLADMLGVHRPSISLVAREFQKAGLIRYSRGTLTILDRAGIERVCCECYATITNRSSKLLALKQPSHPADGSLCSASNKSG